MKRERKKITIQLPSMVEMLKKVRCPKIPATKKHRPKKGGKYHRASSKKQINTTMF